MGWGAPVDPARPLAGFIGPLPPEKEYLRSGGPPPMNLPPGPTVPGQTVPPRNSCVTGPSIGPAPGSAPYVPPPPPPGTGPFTGPVQGNTGNPNPGALPTTTGPVPGAAPTTGPTGLPGQPGPGGNNSPTPDRPLAGFIGPLPIWLEHLRSGGLPASPADRPLAGFIGPLAPDKEPLRSGPPSRIPANGHYVPTNGYGPVPVNNPYQDLTDTGNNVVFIYNGTTWVLTQPINLDAANAKVTASQTAMNNFFTGVFDGLTPQQRRTLQPLAKNIDNAKTPQELAAAEQAFDKALDGMLTTEQKNQFTTLQRNIDTANFELKGQQLGQQYQTGLANWNTAQTPAQRLAAQNQLVGVVVDAHNLVADMAVTRGEWKLQDATGLALTDAGKAQLAGPLAQLQAAAAAVNANPSDPVAQRRLAMAAATFDYTLSGLVGTADFNTIQGLERDLRMTQGAAQIVHTEGAASLEYTNAWNGVYNVPAGQVRPLNATTRLALAQENLNVIRANQDTRSLVLSGAPEDQVGESMLTARLLGNDYDVHFAQFNYDAARTAHNSAWLLKTPTQPGTTQATTAGGIQLVSFTGPPSAVAAPGAPTQEALLSAGTQLNFAISQRDDFNNLLKQNQPAPEKPSGWAHGLQILGALGEIAGGVILAGVSSWTGIGAVAGGAIVVDGTARLVHAIDDTVNDTQTDTYQSRLFQTLGMSQGAANNTDIGLSLVATVPVGGWGAATAVVKGSSLLVKGGGALSGLLVVDSAQAQVRTMIAGEQVNPFTVDRAIAAGMSPMQANYAVVIGGIIAPTGLMAAGARRGPGVVKTNFHTFDPAKNPGPATVADWYGPNAPFEARVSAAATHLGRTNLDGTPVSSGQVLSLANRVKGPVVLAREAPDGQVVGAAAQTKWSGSVGRDPLGGKLPAGTIHFNLLGGNNTLATQQVVSAAVLGGESFTKAAGVSWNTQDRQAGDQVEGASITTRRVTRNAPTLLRGMADDQRPQSVTDALDTSNMRGPLSTGSQELRNLARIPGDERAAWPMGSEEFVFRNTYERPLTTFGSVFLGRLLHPLDQRSYVGWLNAKVNVPQRILQFNRFARSKINPPRVIQTFDPPAGKTGNVRTATLHAPGTLTREQLLAQAKLIDDGNQQFGDLLTLNRTVRDANTRVELLASDLDKMYVVRVTEPGADGTPVLMGGAGIKTNFKGFKNGPEFLTDRRYPTSTAYLTDVVGSRGAGRQAVLASEQAARDLLGQRHFDFFTQWQGARALYHDLGARVPGETVPQGAAMPNLKIWDTRTGPNAQAVLFDAPLDSLPRWLQPRVAESASMRDLEGYLSPMHNEATTMPDGALWLSYRIDYDPTTLNPSVGTKLVWGAQDFKWNVRYTWGPAAGRVVAKPFMPLKPVFSPIANGIGTGVRWTGAAARGVVPYGQWVNEHVNPYGLPKGVQPSNLRANVQLTINGTRYAISEGWRTWQGLTLVSAGAQAATGNAYVLVNDDRAIRPFNGLPGSHSYGLHFPITGTTIVVWARGPNTRLPAGLQENGLQPLARMSAPLNDPTGPKGAGALTAIRTVAAEGNLGIRWFGTNDGVSANTSFSLRLAPINQNFRGDVPVQSGAAGGLSFASSITALMPSMSTSVFYGRNGFIVRDLQINMLGSAQTAVLGSAVRANALKSGEHYTLGNKGVTVARGGLFYTLNPAYNTPDVDLSGAHRLFG